jgi:hypothetical protein
MLDRPGCSRIHGLALKAWTFAEVSAEKNQLDQQLRLLEAGPSDVEISDLEEQLIRPPQLRPLS